ncbi:Fumarylpyruvate hydrolase [Roseomonas mucosa]|uniref:2-keto-4-pentenoate hydratase/2-oxohepta-3-ene-1,7-dioic acid hydratase (Catechol pathway) n=2 Tax=Roseomonas mucosa TaxID=207340 RepID=A0A379MXE1_9PROT|nr:Fumarylpyruvate hydrolase [Roseomonas mucosa]QDD98048.1 Fumarylpyruvate hydrolase [Roseomonas mucosa]UZO90241.1 Fumarylpyruvate hydrolase [Roseomonas mucosa]UZO95076.1 Fumarylpyruvate hydrolase [Roseomonas mucosa]SUE38840.1 2-keto-4-pentenoate hydratase/2-oxohepta-3-ene-1,7-dioic acid hydratase (catechol pathway) [Roseomonas mucosa]
MMSDFVIAPPAQPSLPVRGGGSFPVRRIFCVGRNYAEHAREMGSDPDREPPFYFTKPADAVLVGGADMPYPPATKDLHHEMELVVAIGTGGRDIAESDALTHVWGYCAGLDMTRRDLQNAAKKTGRPWDMGKGFDHSAPMGGLVPAQGIDPGRGRIELKVNGQTRQVSDLGQMIWSVPEVIANLSRLVELAPGDLIMTGTPEGVAAVAKGDVLEGSIEGVGTVRTVIV